MKTKTWLPLFNGFYGTIFEPNEDCEIECIEQKRAENGLTEIKNIFDLCKFDYDFYENGVASDCVKFVEDILQKLGVVQNIYFENLYSPKEYNFSNDSINVIVHYSDDNLKRIVSLIDKYSEQWAQYLKDKFTSCDGFCSFYPNNPEQWNIEGCLKHETQCGSILEFMVYCYANEENEEYEYLYEDMHDYATRNNSLQAENYDELTEKEFCPVCSEFVQPCNFNGNCCDDCKESAHKGLDQLYCVICKDSIENKWYHRSLKHRVLIGDLKIDSVMCSDCALKHENISVLI